MKNNTRTKILLSENEFNLLENAHIFVAGVGGVGGYVAENIVRAGVAQITILDGDKIDSSNINRQILALNSTVGQRKVEVMKKRLLDINPDLKINIIDDFMTTAKVLKTITIDKYDFIADCIDSVACKSELIYQAQKLNIPIISAMGAGNRIDISKVRICSLNQTSNCPLAREIRRRLRTLGGSLNYKVIFSDEPRRPPFVETVCSELYESKAINGTISYMPAIFGVMMAGEIIKQIITKNSFSPSHSA